MKYLFLLLFGLLVFCCNVVEAKATYIHDHNERLGFIDNDVGDTVINHYEFLYSPEAFRPPITIASHNINKSEMVITFYFYNLLALQEYWLGDEL